MKQNKHPMATGLAVGAAAVTALGAAGMYMAHTQPKEMKKMIKKAAHGAEKAMVEVDKVIGQYL